MSDHKPALLPSLLKMKCPNCRKGDMFCNHGIFPFKDMLKMPDKCPECGQKMELEVGFYYGTGYVSYGLTLALMGASFILYAIVFGLSYKDNSIFYALGVGVAAAIVLQPWLMRISRVLYLYMFVKYGKGSMVKSQEI
ncbi:MAG TPA: DUF983 domain-containing protein [Flavipsychrobacter sp.]|jgi:uncharacterized protein (DUF983 family)|nr:DUF983 domain-containing protein [Flavipsychrobacter sp.]